MPTRTIVHFEIPAADPQRLRDFYAQCFGWTSQDSRVPGLEYWRISTGPEGKSVGGGLYRKTGPDDRPRNFIGVEKIDEAIERFKSAGGTQVVPKMEVPGIGWSFIGADPEGNMIALFQPKAMPEPHPVRRKAVSRKAPRKATTKRGHRKR